MTRALELLTAAHLEKTKRDTDVGESVDRLSKTLQGFRDSRQQDRVLDLKEKQLNEKSGMEEFFTRGKIADTLLKEVQLGTKTPQQARDLMSGLNSLQTSANLNNFLTSSPLAPQTGGPSIQIPQGVGGQQPQFLPPTHPQSPQFNQQDQASAPSQDDLFATDLTAFGVPKEVKSESGMKREKRILADAEIEKQIGAQEGKFSVEQERNLRTLQGQLTQTAILFKQMSDITTEKTGLPPGRRAGIANKILGATGINPKVAEFNGDLTETVTSIAKIAAPSAKVGPDLLKVFAETMPDDFANLAEVKGQLSSSLANAFLKHAATVPEDFPDGLTLEQVQAFRTMAEAVFDEILDAPASSPKRGKLSSGVEFEVL